jgi:hypothetical protein
VALPLGLLIGDSQGLRERRGLVAPDREPSTGFVNREARSSAHGDGREVVGVRLTNADEAAWLYLSDYRRIVEDHGTPGQHHVSSATARGCANGEGL